MSSGFPNYRPVPQYVVDNLNLKKKAVYTSRLNAWIRVIGNSGNGLVLQSNPNLPIFGSQSVYGNSEKPGAIGLDWEGNVVTVQEEDRGYRPSPIIEGLNLKDNQFGISRECSFTITCFSKGQVSEIQKYFGEPGHTVLVEFGWDLERSLNQRVGLNSSEIANVGLDFGNILEKRRNSEGDYNALLGFIVGFKIASEGENFKCDVRIMGMGQMPATMQIHKPVVEKDKNTDPNSTSGRVVKRNPVFTSTEKGAEEDVGRLNFMYMFNSLPGHKQTPAIRNLIDVLGKEENYINFNDETRNKLAGETDGSWWNEINAGGKRLSIPKGTDLIGNEKFIKFETFKRILDTNDIIESEAGVNCGDGKLPTKIFTEFTICSAFDEMFSTDKNVLIIPNTNVPDFGFISILLEDDSIQRPNQDCSQKDSSGNTAVQFPERVDLGETSIKEGYLTRELKGTNYGFFDNLYINFDYALDIIASENSTYRDVILGMANGMASAVCGMWQFQIIQAPAPKTIKNPNGAIEIEKDKMCLQLVEMRCTSEKKQSPMEMVHNGEGSFFLNSALDIDLPSDMMSSIISNRKKSDGSEPAADIEGDKDERETNNAVFKAALEDKVLKTFNEKNAPEVTSESQAGGSDSGDEPDEVQTKADMYNKFLGKIGSYPSRKDGRFNLDNRGDGEEVDALDVIFFPTFDDELLFKKKRNQNNPNYKPSSNEIKGTGPLMGMLKYNFEVHGNSGFNHGDVFGIIGIPEKYNRTGAFTITNVEHTINQMQWTTSIEGLFRPSK